MGKRIARLQRLACQAHEALQAVFTTRILALLLAVLVLWGSGGFVKERACTTSSGGGGGGGGAAGGEWLHLHVLAPAAPAADGTGSAELMAAAAAGRDVPDHAGPPYVLPKLIHQTVEDRSAMSCQVRESVQTWIDMNPGYTHKLYDAADRVDFVRRHYPEMLELFLALPTNVERADTWRYLALHRLGGVYADSDVKCMQPIDTWNSENGRDAALLVGIAKRSRHGLTQEFNQFVMAAMPGHPVMGSMPTVIAANFAASFLRGSEVPTEGLRHDTGVLSRTGPGAFTAALKLYAQRVGATWPVNATAAHASGGVRFGSVRAMPKWVLGMGWDTIELNMTCDEVKAKVRPEAYICHQFFGTWKKQPEVAVNLTYGGCGGSLRYSAEAAAAAGTGAGGGDGPGRSTGEPAGTAPEA